MFFSQAQKDFLRNLIYFEIIDFQNQFVSCSKTLKNLINDVKNSIKFDQMIIDQIKIDINSHFILNSILNEKTKNLREKENKENQKYEDEENKFLKFLKNNEFSLKIVHSAFLGIKTSLKQRIEQKKEIKKILEAALFLDLFDFFIRKFDIIYNSDFLIKIAKELNEKFNFDVFHSWIIKKETNPQEYFLNHENNQNLKTKQIQFDEKFLRKIIDFSESELISKKKKCIKFLNKNHIKIDKKKHYNFSNSLNFFFDSKDDFFIFFDKSIINLIQNDIDYFYLNEFTNKNKISILDC